MSQNSDQQVEGEVFSTKENTRSVVDVEQQGQVDGETADRNEQQRCAEQAPYNQNAIGGNHLFFINSSELLISELF